MVGIPSSTQAVMVVVRTGSLRTSRAMWISIGPVLRGLMLNTVGSEGCKIPEVRILGFRARGSGMTSK